MSIRSPEGYVNNAFLGDVNRSDLEYQGHIDMVNKIHGVLVTKPIDGVAKKKINESSRNIVRELANPGEFVTDEVKVLVETSRDKNRPTNKEVAENRLDRLAKATFEAAWWGDNAEIRDAVGKGDATKIDELLPGPLKGLGERMVRCLFKNEKVLGILKKLEIQRVNSKNAGKNKNGLLTGKLDKAINEILDITDEGSEYEVGTTVAFLDAEKVRLGGGEGEMNDWQRRQMEMFEVQSENQRRQLELGVQAEKTTYDTWLATITGKGGRAGLPAAIWTYEPPGCYEGEGSEWNGFLDTVTTWSNWVMVRRAMLGGARDIGKAYFDQDFPKMQERYFAQIYNDPRTGLRRALEFVGRDLYVETITPLNGEIRAVTEDEKKGGVKGIFAMRYEVENGGDATGAKIMAGKNKGGRREYLMRVKDELLRGKRNPTKEEEDYASMSASLALDFLEMGFGMDGPDHKRKCNFATEAARTKSRPGFKFGDKTEGGEVFSGAWTAFYRERYADEIEEALRRSGVTDGSDDELNKTNELIVQMARGDGLIPQVLCGSILDTPVMIEDGETTLGRALQASKKLIVSSTSTEDMMYAINKWFENASTFWDYVSGTAKLDFKGGIREIDSVLREFAKDLNNSYLDLRKRGVVGADQLIGAIGGAAGLVPSEPMILNVPISVSDGATYSFLINSMLDNMPGLLKGEVDKVKDRLGADLPLSNNLQQWWEFSKDGMLSQSQRESWRRRLVNKPRGWFEKGYRRLGEKKS